VAELASCGVDAIPVSYLKYGLQVTKNERKIQKLFAYLEGRIELQDASSQAVIEALDMPRAGRILDYCAGGGGKTLSLAAQTFDNAAIAIYAHDSAFRRMADLPARAARAGAMVQITENPANTAPYAMILTDVPCSGSGSWRRDPQGKWALSAARLDELVQTQAQILDACLPLLAVGGVLAYSTCSVLPRENEAQIAAFVQRHPQVRVVKMQRFGLAAAQTDGGFAGQAPLGDVFFLAVLQVNR
jgi:16S rRNA (cytosine967-C5)-methyltransferase